jgi:hypothetical protein
VVMIVLCGVGVLLGLAMMVGALFGGGKKVSRERQRPES